MQQRPTRKQRVIARRSIRLKGIFNPFQLVSAQAVEQDAIEAAGSIRLPRITQEETTRGVNDALLFAAVNAGGGAPKARITSEAHFHKDQGVAIERNTVDFAAAHPVIAGQDAEPGPFQVSRRQVFGGIAGHLLGRERGILMWHQFLQLRKFI